MIFVVTGGCLAVGLAVFTDVFDSSSSSPSSSSASTSTSTAAPVQPVATTTTPPASSPTATPTQQPSDFQAPPLPRYTTIGTYRTLETYPHDPKAFAQGLEVKNTTHLYESIGLYGQSAMRIVETKTGRVTLETTMDPAFFGEGATLVTPTDGSEPFLLQLTWKEQTAFLYHAETLQEISRFPYQTTNTQGWGAAYDTHQDVVYVTDGTEFVHTWKMVRNDKGQWSYQEISKIPVTFELNRPDMQGPQTLKQVNEIEYDPTTRTLLANVWFQNVIIRIDIASGRVTHTYDLTAIYPDRTPEADVLNGIAVIPNQPGRLYVTGKLWPHLFYIELVDGPART